MAGVVVLLRPTRRNTSLLSKCMDLLQCWRTMSRGVVVTMVSGISAVRICESGMAGMLGEIAVGLAGLVQFREVVLE